MLSHSPFGLGHPYRYEPDQRIPTRPITGEKWKISARTSGEIKSVTLHVTRAHSSEHLQLTFIGPAQSQDFGPYGETAKFIEADTHLADAAARSGEYPGEKTWEIELAPLERYENVAYWLETDSGERTVHFSAEALAWESDDQNFLKSVGSFPPSISLGKTRLLKDSHGTVFRLQTTLPLKTTDKVIGFGERFHSVNQVGHFVDAVVYEEYKGQGHRTYLPAPFGIVIGSGFGFYIRTSTPSRYDVGVTNPDELRIEIDITPRQTHCEIVGYLGSPIDVVRQYLAEFPSPKNPPSWIYSLWGSSNEWNTQKRVENEISQSIALGIDLGVVVIEAWSDETTFTVFRDGQYQATDGSRGLKASEIKYPTDGAWPNPQQMIEEMHEKNIKVILWQNPVIKDMQGVPDAQEEAIWNYAIKNNLVVKDEIGDPYRVRGFWLRHGLLPDLTDAKVRRWWADLHRYLVTELGVDGFKTDGGEHAWGQDLQYLDGKTGLEKNNLLPVAYAQTFHELMIDSKKDGVTFSRSGFAGSSSFPTFWAGDEDSTWEAYRASIRAGITASASGIFFWGWDIGGFSGAIPSAELYLRGTAMAAFCPIMQFHSEYNHHRIPSNDRTPWNIALQHKDLEVIEIFRHFAGIRKSLIPYLAEEGEVAIQTGRPLMSGLFFDYFDDEEIWLTQYQYMLGRYLLVAPVVDESILRMKIYLPKGSWIDFWNKDTYEGAQWIEVDTPFDQIPVFIKSDAPNWVLAL